MEKAGTAAMVRKMKRFLADVRGFESTTEKLPCTFYRLFYLQRKSLDAANIYVVPDVVRSLVRLYLREEKTTLARS